MRDNPILPPPHARAAFRKTAPLCLDHRRRLHSGHAAKLAREMAREMEAAIGTFPRGDFSPPANVLRALRSDAAMKELRS